MVLDAGEGVMGLVVLSAGEGVMGLVVLSAGEGVRGLVVWALVECSVPIGLCVPEGLTTWCGPARGRRSEFFRSR